MSNLMHNAVPDRLIKGLFFNEKARLVAASTTRLVEEARRIHDTWPTATAAFGRTLTGGLLSSALADEEEEITLQIMGSGPIGLLLVVANGKGKAKGTVGEPHTDLPLNAQKKLDVGGAVGLPGRLMIIKDQGKKHPYHGVTPLVSGEIGEDLADYYSRSEQIPTAVGLGVKVHPSGEVAVAGGFIIQVLPGIKDKELNRLDEVLSSLTGVTEMLAETPSLEDFVFKISGGKQAGVRADWQMLSEVNPVYYCGCSRERFEKALISLGKKELEEVLSSQGKIETCCQFCHRTYDFTKKETECWFKQF